MVLIGLLLIAAAVAAAIILVVQNEGNITVHVFETDYDIAAYWLAIAGLVIMAVLALGLLALRIGAAHAVRRRRERRELVKENRRLSERAASLNSPGADQSATSGRLHHGSTAGGASAGSGAGGAHADPAQSRADEPGRMPPAEGGR